MRKKKSHKKGEMAILAGKWRMESSATDSDAPDLVCQLDNVQGMVDALTAVRWKRHQVRLSSLSPTFCSVLGKKEDVTNAFSRTKRNSIMPLIHRKIYVLS